MQEDAQIELIERETSVQRSSIISNCSTYDVSSSGEGCVRSLAKGPDTVTVPEVDNTTSSTPIKHTVSRLKHFRSFRSNQPKWSQRKVNRAIIMAPFHAYSEVSRWPVTEYIVTDVKPAQYSSVDMIYANDSHCGYPYRWSEKSRRTVSVPEVIRTVTRLTASNYTQYINVAKHYVLETDDIDKQLNTLRQETINKCYSRSKELSPLVILGESLESARLILSLLGAVIHPLKTYRKMIDEYSRLKRLAGHSKAAAKQLADIHLFYNFGIKPIINDIISASKLKKSLKDEFQTDRSRASRKFSRSPSDRDLSIIHSYETYEREDVFNVTLKSRYSTPNSRLFARLDFNAVSSAWELIPFSFLVDWFINVGASLQSLSSFSSPGTDMKMCITQKTTESYCQFLFIPAKEGFERPGNSFVRTHGDGFALDSFNKFSELVPGQPGLNALLHSRERIETIREIVVPAFVPPQFNSDFASVQRLITALALQAQVTVNNLRKSLK